MKLTIEIEVSGYSNNPEVDSKINLSFEEAWKYSNYYEIALMELEEILKRMRKREKGGDK